MKLCVMPYFPHSQYPKRDPFRTHCIQCSGYGMGHTRVMNAVGMEWVTPQCSGYGMGHTSMQWVWNGSRLSHLNAVGAEWVIIMPVLTMMFFPGNQERCHKIV